MGFLNGQLSNSSNKAELLALKAGLQIAIYLGVQLLEINTKLQVLTRLLINSDPLTLQENSILVTVISVKKSS